VCCSRVEKEEHSAGVTLVTFGTPGDGLDVQDAGDFATISGLGGSGSRGFLIDSINDCGGTPAIGCGTTAACDGIPDDDPDRVITVTMDAFDSGLLGPVIAHERGHNACLPHVDGNPCDLMRASVSGGCLSASECASFDAARQTTGGSCDCHADLPAGDPVTDGLACSDGPIVGICSGGVCGEASGDAGVELLAAGGPASTGEALLHSGASGGWKGLGSFGRDLRGLAYDPDGGVLYGVESVAGGDDVLVRIDPTTGATSLPKTVTGHADLTALAFDPGATSASGDDRLLALSSDGMFEDLIAIDPATGAPTFVGGLDSSPGDGAAWEGMAYDDVNDELYVSGFVAGSLFRVDTSTCPSYCTVVAVPGVSLARTDPSLAFSRATGNLYMVGGQSGGRVLYDTIDATSYATATTIGVDPYTVGGLSALPTPLPEPAASLALAAGAACVGWLARRRCTA
jgi:hypothetical protein